MTLPRDRAIQRQRLGHHTEQTPQAGRPAPVKFASDDNQTPDTSQSQSSLAKALVSKNQLKFTVLICKLRSIRKSNGFSYVNSC